MYCTVLCTLCMACAGACAGACADVVVGILSVTDKSIIVIIESIVPRWRLSKQQWLDQTPSCLAEDTHVTVVNPNCTV